MNNLHATFDMRLGGKAPSALAHRLDKNGSSLRSLDRMMHRLLGEGLAVETTLEGQIGSLTFSVLRIVFAESSS